MELMKGTLDIMILRTLQGTEMHGYAISKSIRATSGDVLEVEEGALYPALRRLEKRGRLRSRWGKTDTNREAKFYRLTDLGRDELENAVADWKGYVAAMGRVLDGSKGGS